MNSEAVVPAAGAPNPRRLGWRGGALLWVLAVLLLAGLWWLWRGPSSVPMLRGKPLDYWARQLLFTREARTEAEAVFRQAGPEVTPGLVAILNQRDDFSRKLLEWSEALPDRVHHWLYRRLRTHARAVERAGAATALGLVGDPRPAALDALARALRDEDSRIQVAAGLSLAALGPLGGERLLAELPRLKGRIRHLALGALSPDNAPLAPAVTALMEEVLHGIHLVPLNTCAEALSRFGPDAVPVIFTLPLASAGDPGRRFARVALAQVIERNYAFLQEWIRRFPEQPPAVRRFALEVLNGTARYPGQRAMAFAAALRDPDPEVRRVAKDGLLKLRRNPGARYAFPLLEAALRDENPAVRQDAAEVLDHFGSPTGAVLPAPGTTKRAPADAVSSVASDHESSSSR